MENKQKPCSFSEEELSYINDRAKQIKDEIKNLSDEEIFNELLEIAETIHWKRFMKSLTKYKPIENCGDS